MPNKGPIYKNVPIDQDVAITTAENYIGADVDAQVSCWLVRRIDRVESFYYEVIIQLYGGSIGVVLVDRQTGTVTSSVRLTSGATPIAISQDRVPDLAGLVPADEVELVWAVCQATRSPFHPLWRVRRGRQIRYLDQRGSVWTNIGLQASHAGAAGG